MESEGKPYDLAERTFQFALSVRLFFRQHKWDPVSWTDVTQVIRSSGSVAANFIEANEGLSTDDSLYRFRLCKKEARESGLWLQLIEDTNPVNQEQEQQFTALKQEASELVKILATIIRNKTK